MNNVVSILLIVALGVAVAVAIIVALTRKGSSSLKKEEYQAKWLSLEQSITKDKSTWHMAIIGADKLLDAALRARGFKGKTMGERMQSARDIFTDRNAIWTAHKLRNQIAHEPDVKVTAPQMKQALKAFKTALQDVGAL